MKVNQLVAIAFLFLLAIAEFGATVVLVDFEINREQIAHELCDQRELMPAMQTCKGNCVLAKKLRAAEEAANHPVELLLFEYTGETEAPTLLPTLTPAIRTFAVAQYLELQGHTKNDDWVPWQG